MARSRQASATVRIAPDLLDKAHVLCAHERGGVGGRRTVQELIDQILRPELTRLHAELLGQIAADQQR